jgi:Asp-tRNA(Asn)/Glu-tRNA(Gln) amidotransferase A subunit family amidase
MAGYPHITVSNGGRYLTYRWVYHFSAPTNKEAELLAIAYAYEQATKHRRHLLSLEAFSLDLTL